MWLINKVYTFLILLGHPGLEPRKRWYLRFYYKWKVFQARFFLQDYLIKQPYKEIRFVGEFAPELKFALPHAYWHYKNGTLKETESYLDTKCFYYFSEHHKENEGKRIWDDFKFQIDIPNSFDHGVKYDFRKWKAVPLKEHYADRSIQFDKPSVVISNKYNTEWNGEPVNFLSADVLEELFDLLKEEYQIIYNRPRGGEIIDDNSAILHLDEEALFTKYPEVIDLTKLYSKYSEVTFNEFQMRVYAGCSQFVSVQGGNSVLASYFGGHNVIYAVRGLEIEMNEYETIYPKLSNCTIVQVGTYGELLETVRRKYADG